MSQQWDRLWTDVHLATMVADGRAYGAIRNAAIAEKNGRIAWLGKLEDLDRPAAELCSDIRQGNGCWVTPGLVDCHTHLVFGGNRAQEFERRLAGESYAAIAASGGGIKATVRHTRDADDDTLFRLAAQRLEAFLAQGVTTIEVKSGYGLDVETELRMLRVGRRLGDRFPITVKTTFLGAHAIPLEYAQRRDDYVTLLIEEMLPRVAEERLADAVDAFCETIGFSVAEVTRLFERAAALNLPVKLHADQLTNGGGAALAARFGALSADHLEYTDEEGISAMADADCVAVLLPGAFYTLGETQMPLMGTFAKHGVPIALASDCNPGSSPISNLLAILNMGCVLFGMTPEQALAGVTRHGARALGLEHEVGTLEPGKWADLAFWAIETPAELAYWMGGSPLHGVVKRGEVVRGFSSSQSER